MTLYPVVRPVYAGDDDSFSFFGDFTNSSQDTLHKTCSKADQSGLNSTTRIASNFTETSCSQTPSPLVESPGSGAFELQSSTHSLKFFQFSRYGEVHADELWQIYSGGSREKPSLSAIVETLNTQQVYTGNIPPTAINYQEARNNTISSTPFDFNPSIPLQSTQLTCNGYALSPNTNDIWRPESMAPTSPFEFPEQCLYEIYGPDLDVSSKCSTTSTATQTTDDLLVDCKSPLECSPPTLSPPMVSKQSVTQRASRNFPCGIDGCTRSYTRKFELSRHLKRHSGLKEYHCRFLTCAWAAPNGFTRKDHLKQHLRQVHKTSA